MPSNPLLENNVQELLYVETHAEYSAGSGIDITNNVISLDPNVSAAIDNKLDTSSFSSYSATIDNELQYVSANAGKTYSGIAPIVVNNDTNEISADTQDISFGVGLDFTGGVLSVTAQGGDPEVESLVKANSGYWNEVSSVSSTSSVLNNQITALRNDLNTVSTNTGYLYNDIQTTSGILSAAIDYVSANAGGASGYVSGENYVLIDNGSYSSFYSTIISGDVQVVTGKIYNGGSYVTSGLVSLSSLQGQINNKLNASDIAGTKTLSYYDNHYEVGGISYKPDGFSGMSAQIPWSANNAFEINYHTSNQNYLYSAKIVIEASNYRDIDGWKFEGYENGSATYTKYFTLNDNNEYVHGNGWNNITNIEASAVTYSALSIEPLAFKSDLTGGGGDAEVNDYVYNNSATINDVNTTVQSNSAIWAGGTSLTGDAQGAVDEVYSNSALWSEITGVSSNYQPIGNYATQTDLEQISGDLKSDIDYVSANAITSLDGYATTSEVNTVSSYLSGQIDNKLDSTSFNPNDYYPMVGNPSGFISGVDLSDYQTKAGMTAYQPAGDYATTGDLYNTSSILSGAIDYISGNAGTTYTGVAPIVVTGNTISADSFDLNIGSGLAFENDTLYVSAESVPEGVMVESACEYNAVNEISAYNGSAIAQYGAEKQWLQHDDTLVHAANSAQYALGVNLSAVAQLLGVDETVLYSNFTGRPTTVGSYIDLSESPLNFTEIAIYLNGSGPTVNNISNGYERVPAEQLSSTNGLEFVKEFVGTVAGNTSTVHDMGCGYSGTSGTRWTKWYGYSYNVENKTTNFNNSTHLNIWKVIGIGRK